METMCQKCRKRKSCKTPCAYVEAVLTEDNRQPFYEVNAKGLNGEDATILKSRNHRYEVNESGLDYMHSVDMDGDAWTGDDKVSPFTTDADSPWSDYQPTLTQTTVFMARFFHQKSFDEIADELGVDARTVQSHYQHAKARMMEALKLADMKENTIAKYRLALERSEKATGKLPRYIQWFLMNKVFNLTVGDIAELEGSTSATVAAKIRVAYDKFVTGEYILLEPSQDQIEAAQARLYKRQQSNKIQSRKVFSHRELKTKI